MKNVIIFQDFVNDVTYGKQWTEKELFNYFNAQVEQAISLGWKPEDIIIGTNLSYQNGNATIVRLKQECKFNKYFNKQFGICELLEEGLLNKPFWFHDFDDWPLHYFEFPDFEGDIGMAKYIDASQWNTGSIFVKPTSQDIWRLIVDFMVENRDFPPFYNKGDEDLVNITYRYYPEIQSRFSLLNNQYNTGCTQFDLRYNSATKPVYVAAFKPDDPKQIKLFSERGLINENLLSIFDRNNLL